MQVLSEGLKSLKNIIQNAVPQGEGLKHAQILSICSQKGGVGKTTSAVNLAYNLAASGKRHVLLIDLDPQGHVETSLAALVPDGQRYRPMSSIFLEKKPNVMEGIVETKLPNFRITPGDKSLIETESLLTTKIGKEFLLKEALKNAATHFDFIVIDCPPNLGNLTLNALVASHYCVVPCEMSVLSLEGVSDIFETIETINERLNRKLSVLGILLTRVDSRNLALNAAVKTQLEKHASAHLFTTQVTVNTALAKAQMAGKPIAMFSPSSKGAQNYQALADELLERIQERTGEASPSAASA